MKTITMSDKNIITAHQEYTMYLISWPICKRNTNLKIVFEFYVCTWITAFILCKKLNN